MQIAIDGVPAAKPNKTGVEWYVYHLIKEMNQLRPELEVGVYTHRPLDFELKGNWKNIVLTWPFLGWKYMWSLRLRVDKPQVVFSPGDGLPPALSSTVKTVATVHDLAWKHVPEVFTDADRKRIDAIYARYAREATHLVAVSETTRQDVMTQFSITPERITTTELGIDNRSNRWRPRKEQDVDVQRVRAAYNLTGPYTLFISRLEAKKGVLPMLKGYVRWREKYADADYTFPTVVLGGKPGGVGAQEIIDFAKSHEGIRLLGYVPAEDAPALMSGAELYTLSSLYEGFGIPLVEAMASGTPIVAVDLPINREVLGTTYEGRRVLAGKVVTAPTETEWYHYFANSFLPNGRLNRAPYKTAIAAGLERAKELTWEETARKTLNVLCDTLSTNSK